MLAKKKILLEQHFPGQAEFNYPVETQHAIQFTDFQYYSDWKEHRPSFGVAVVLHASQDISHLPEPLKEIYRFGQIHLYGIGLSGNFLPPAEIIPVAGMKEPATDAEYLMECAWHYEQRSDVHLDLGSLRPFYTDSGSYLLFDKSEKAWIGGIEAGDLYGTGMKLQEALDRLFGLLQVQSVVGIGEIIPEKLWKEKN